MTYNTYVIRKSLIFNLQKGQCKSTGTLIKLYVFEILIKAKEQKSKALKILNILLYIKYIKDSKYFTTAKPTSYINIFINRFLNTQKSFSLQV